MVRKKEKNNPKKVLNWALIILIVLILGFGLYYLISDDILPSPEGEHEIVRSIDKVSVSVNEIITISLDVVVDSDDTAYAIEEVFPVGVEVVDLGGGNFTETLRMFEMGLDLENTTKQYTIKFSIPGTYDISGTYAFSPEGELKPILGTSQIVVVSAGGDPPESGGGGGGGTPPTVVCTAGQTKQCGTTDVGECKFGTTTCSNNQWSSCSGNVGPIVEIADDGLDNNCNGKIDESLDEVIDTDTPLPDKVVNLGIFFIIGLIVVVLGIIIFLVFKYKKRESANNLLESKSLKNFQLRKSLVR